MTTKCMLSIAVLGSVAFTFKPGEKDKVKWKMGVALYSFNQHSLDKALNMAAQSGVKYVEGFSFYNLRPDFKNKAMGDLDDQETVQLKKMLKGKGLTMSSMYVGDANNLIQWKRYFETGRKLGLKYLVCEPKKELLGGIDSLAGLYKIKIAIHQHVKGSSIYWHPDSVLAAIKGRQNIGACADLGHWVRSGLDPVECIKILSGHIVGVHLKDVDQTGTDVDLGKGAVHFTALIKELKRQDFNGFIHVECEHNMKNNLEDVRKALAYFNVTINNVF